MPRLSIIVPVYNVEDYLAQCLESLRTLEPAQDIEIVCVNDGSTDRSRAILGLYAQVDERIKVVDKPNGGLSSARNAGIDAATGDVLSFVDSDDFVEPSYATCLLDTFEQNDSDVVVFGARIWPDSASYPWLDFVLSPRTCYYPGFSSGLLNDPGTRPFAWRVAVRRELLEEHDLRFDEDVEFGEDQVFLLELYPRARHISVISDKPYVYRADRSGSLMEGRFGDLKLRAHDHVRIVEHVLRDWSEQGFLAKWGRDLFFWSVGFCVPDIVGLKNPGRSDMLIYLACTYEAFYPRAQLERYCAERGELAAFARAVLVDHSMTVGFGRKALFYRHTLAHEGLRPFVERPIERLKGLPIAERASDLVYQYAPNYSVRAHAEHESLLNASRDADQLVRALEALNDDLVAAGYDPILEDSGIAGADGADTGEEADDTVETVESSEAPEASEIVDTVEAVEAPEAPEVVEADVSTVIGDGDADGSGIVES